MSILSLSRLLRRRPRTGRFVRDSSGLAALEFAIILPVMVLLYLSGFEVSEAFMINRKVTHATSVLGDLVAQSEQISDGEMNNILDAASTVINPYPTGPLTMVVSGVEIDDEGVATVTWSDARNRSAHSVGAELTLPDGVRQPNTFLIVAEVHYAYSPTFGESLVGTIDLSDEFYLRPRLQNEVDRL